MSSRQEFQDLLPFPNRLHSHIWNLVLKIVYVYCVHKKIDLNFVTLSVCSMSSVRLRDSKSHARVQCMSHLRPSPSIRVMPMWQVALGPWRRPMVSRTSSMRLMTIKIKRSTCPKKSMYAVDVAAVGTMHTRCITTGLPCGCDALNVMTRRARLWAGTCCGFTLQQPEWSSGPFFSQVHASLWAAAMI